MEFLYIELAMERSLPRMWAQVEEALGADSCGS